MKKTAWFILVFFGSIVLVRSNRWNISDRHSWLDDFPVRGKKDYPLLFDKALQPKKAFYHVISMAQ